MFANTFRTSTAVVAGMALAGAVLVAPGTAAPATGRAIAWGENSAGQLGTNSTTNSPVPVDTGGALAGRTVTAISAGDSHTCAVADGLAYCWGFNASGQLGNTSTTNSIVPAAVDTSGVLRGKTITAVTTGGGHTCAVADGRAYCWGFNATGRLGNNSTTDSPVPVAVDTSGVLAGKTITAVTAGGAHTCALADGMAYCWGYNISGQLGTNSTTNSSVPVAVDTSGVLAGKTVTAVSRQRLHVCRR